MTQSASERIRDSVGIVGAIARKDIVDALRNRLVLSLVIMLSIMLLLPRALPLLFEQPVRALPTYDLGAPKSLAALAPNEALSVLPVRSEREFDLALCSALFPTIGLRLPADFDRSLDGGGPVVVEGAACWGKRYEVTGLVPGLEAELTRSLGHPVKVDLQGRWVYPPAEGLSLGIALINAVLLLLLMGIVLVPGLLLEEKRTHTLSALLVSPVSYAQVVAGKALAGAFYILVTGIMVFAFCWTDVTHWGIAALFVLGGGVFSVGLGLVLGCFFERQVDVIGPMLLILLVLLGGLLKPLLGVTLPAWAARLFSWVPSVALAEVCRAAFAEQVSAPQVAANLVMVLAASVPLYALVIGKLRSVAS